MLQVKHLTAIQEKDLRVLLEDVNFTLGPGDKAAVIGEEGNGKSTLLKLIYDPRLVSGPGLLVRRDRYGWLEAGVSASGAVPGGERAVHLSVLRGAGGLF